MLLLSPLSLFAAEDVWLSDVVNIREADQEHSRPALNKNTSNQPLRVAGREFEKGLGTQADNRTAVQLNGATRFTGFAGVDDATESAAAIRLEIFADGQSLWRQEMKKGDAPVALDLDVHGRKTLVLVTADIGNTESQALADWADAKFTVEGDKPKSMLAPVRDEAAVILTPAAPATPRINGARVFGVRPGNPFLFQIPATGDRPMTFAATGLPSG